jgi:uncharacterized protein involved in type VI secretion and phage assembly
MPSFSDIFSNLFKKRLYGVYLARVVENVDPDLQWRVLVSLPETPGGAPAEAWARLATLMAGKQRGTWFHPEVDDEVLVAFEGGDPRRPYVVGALWNASAPPPEGVNSNDPGAVRLIRSRNGNTIALHDQMGDEALVLQTPKGQSVILQDSKGGLIEISDSNGNQVRLTPEGVQVVASSKVTVTASTVEVSAASLTVNSGMSTFSGVLKADTVITNSVISASYSPGVGNIM